MGEPNGSATLADAISIPRFQRFSRLSPSGVYTPGIQVKSLTALSNLEHLRPGKKCYSCCGGLRSFLNRKYSGARPAAIVMHLSFARNDSKRSSTDPTRRISYARTDHSRAACCACQFTNFTSFLYIHCSPAIRGIDKISKAVFPRATSA